MKKLNLLLVDDDPDDRTLTIRELKKDFDIKVKEIKNNKDFIEALENNEFDLVITDYQLKWSNGLEILQNIKNRFPNCPVIMFTGTGNEEIAVAAMKAGLDDYVVKSPKHFIRIPAAVCLAIDRKSERKECKRVEKALHESEEMFKRIFESSPNAITVSNLDGKIIACNQATVELHGFASKKEIIGKNAFDLITEKDHDRAMENMKKTLKEGLLKNIEYTLLTTDGREFPAELSAGVVTDLLGKPISFIALTKDITEQKRVEEEMKKRLMKFNLENGKFYLVKESNPSLSFEAFKDLLKVGYHGFIISRTPERDLKNIVKQNFDFLWLAEKSEEKITPSKLKEIEHRIEEIVNKESGKIAVLIERIDYLIFKNGFKKTLSFVQRLREFAYLTSNIIIFSIDPSTLNRQELRLFEKEGEEITLRIDKMKMPEELFKVLRFVYQENIIGIKPSYMNIGSELQISKPTVRKRIRALISAGFIIDTLRGKNKVIELTEMGRNIFYRV